MSVLAVDVAVWSVLGVVVGYAHHRLPAERLAEDGWLTRLRRWEHDGAVYQRWLRVKRWKDRVPEAGALFAGGVSKRRVPDHAEAGLDRFARETRRAERTHWTLLATGPLFLLWNPTDLAVAMVSYAVVANVPFIAIQRYNRGRVERLLVRKAARR